MQHDDGLTLLTDNLRQQIPARITGDDPMVVAKFFTPWTNWTWYVLSGAQFDLDGNEHPLSEMLPPAQVQDVILHGAVDGHEFEIGDFSLNELRGIRGPAGLTIERDTSWKPKPLSAITCKNP